MRLLLDEHVDKAIAEALRAQGFDVVAVTEDPTLVKLSDDALLVRALEDRRAVLTYDVVDFRRAAVDRLSSEEHHHGIVLVTRRRFPHGKRHAGALIAALRRLLEEMPAEDALVDREWWLVEEGTFR